MDWVVDFKQKLEEREISKITESWKKQSIYKVPLCTKNLHENAYVPRAVSFGPYHHCEGGEWNMQMEAHKRRALSHFLRKSNKPLETYVKELKKVVQQLMDSYQYLDSKWNQNRFLQLMLLDGCFMLEILRAYEAINKPVDKYGDYAGVEDPIFSYHGRINVRPHIRRDMLMLENQIPMPLLVNLVTVEGTIPDPVEYLNKLILKFINTGTKLPPAEVVDPRTKKPWGQKVGDSLHVLDLYRKSLLGFGLKEVSAVVIPPGTSKNSQDIVRSAEKLHQAGVEFETSPTNSLTDISFSCGTLKLPVIIVDDTSEPAFLNLMVFERLHVGAGNEVTSFISFMDNIIHSAKDVSLLHSNGIIHNSFGSEKAVAKMFNGISRDGTPDPEGRLEKVHYMLNAYCNKGWNSHKANLKRTYFKNPWALVSLVAAIFLMILTLVQTVYTIIAYHLPN